MSTWEYAVRFSKIGGAFGPNVNKVWEQRGKDGKTDWEGISQLGKEGWELVNSFTITDILGSTVQIVWVFKRPKLKDIE